MINNHENPALHLQFFIGAAINAVGGVVGGIINSHQQNVQNDLNRQAQQRENAISRQWQEDMFNKYASPAAQVQQRAQAGLNPYADGSVKSQSVGSASTGSIPAGQASPAIGDSIAAAGSAIGNYLIQKPALEGAKLDNETKQLENKKRKMDLAQQAIEMEDYEAARSIKLEMLKDEAEFKKATKEHQRKMIEKLDAEIAALKQKSTDDHNESEGRQALVSLQQEYQKIINSNADEQQKAEIKAKLASATASYASAALASAQAEVAKSQKIQIDNATQIAKNEEGRRAAMALLEEYEQKLINGGLKQDLINKTFENARNNVLSGNFSNFGELGYFLFEHLRSLIPFAASPLKFGE